MQFQGGAGGIVRVLGGCHERPLPIAAEIIPEPCRLHTPASVGVQQNGIEPKSVTEKVGSGEMTHSIYDTGYRRIINARFSGSLCKCAYTARIEGGHSDRARCANRGIVRWGSTLVSWIHPAPVVRSLARHGAESVRPSAPASTKFGASG